MNKIPVIIRREYLSRVKKKSFLITTILLPLGLFLLVALVAFVTISSKSDTTIGVIDESKSYFGEMRQNASSFSLKEVSLNDDESIEALAARTGCDIVFQIFSSQVPNIDSVKAMSASSISLSAQEFLNDEIQTIYRKKLLSEAGIDKVLVDSLENANVPFISKSFEEKETNTGTAVALGYGMGFLMYMVIFIYGVGVMRGVMEEKTNRIAEVIISSVRPFELMMGKIIGIGLVGLTQFLIWGILLFVLQTVLGIVLMPAMAGGMQDAIASNPELGQIAAEENVASELLNQIASQNWLLIIPTFFLYFIGGYFLYAALFAAVGSLVNEDPQDAQQMTLPVTLPIILAFIILASSLDDPNSSLAVFGSIFPLTSPIVMLGRLPYDPPVWQILLSIILLIASFIFTTWVSAKIYRIGILLYGKKVGWKEVFKWLKKA